MSNTANRAPASVAENVETVIRVESETQRPRSRSEAITDAIGGFVGTISFVVAQVVVFAAWVVVNAGTFPQLAPFDPFPYPLLSSITLTGGGLACGLRADEAEPDGNGR